MVEDANHFLTVTKYLMILVGQWEFKDKNRFPVRIYNRCRNTFFYWFILCYHMFGISVPLNWACKVNAVEMSFYYLHAFLASSITYMLSSKKTKRILELLWKYENYKLKTETADVVEEYMRYSRTTNRSVLFLIIIGNFAGWSWLALGITAKMEPTENCPFVEGLVFQIWYPFDIRKHMWLGTTFDVNLLSGAITFFVYSKIMPTVLTLFLLVRIRILKVKVRRWNEDCEDAMTKLGIGKDEAMAFVIKRFVKEHQEVYELMDLVQSASKTIVLFLFFGNAMDLPTYLIQMLLGDAVIFLRNFGALVLALVQVYVFFWFANEVILESLAISDVIYNDTDWITYSKTNKMLLLMVLHRSQRNFALKAAAIGEMSISTFTKILRLCYSITTFFMTAYDPREDPGI